MAISSISSLAASSYAANDTSGKIIQLQRQLESLRKQLIVVNNSRDDDTTKAQKVKQYQTMISNIESRIQQMQTLSTTDTQSFDAQKANIQKVNEQESNPLRESQSLSDEWIDAQNGLGQVIDVRL